MTESFRRRHTLRKSSEFLRCYRRGSRRRGSLLRIHFHSNHDITDDESVARLGITASRKVGNAVVRHRLKRRVREIFRRWDRRSDLAGLDLVVHLEPSAGKTSFSEFRRELEKLLAQVIA